MSSQLRRAPPLFIHRKLISFARIALHSDKLLFMSRLDMEKKLIDSFVKDDLFLLLGSLFFSCSCPFTSKYFLAIQKGMRFCDIANLGVAVIKPLKRGWRVTTFCKVQWGNLK